MLHPLPTQPSDTPWPTDAWPRSQGAPADAATRAAMERFFDAEAKATFGSTFALLLIERGRLVAERYDADHTAESTQPSWSMAKSMLHALIGVLVQTGRLDVDAPPDVPAWQGADDPRRAITLEHLMRMCSGLQFQEAYELDKPSDVIEMLFKSGRDDVAGFAEACPLTSPPGTWWNYSSGTSNILSAIVHRALGLKGDAHRAFMQEALFDRIGMRSCIPKYDASGTWIASSFNFATPRDFARFGLLCLRDGVWDGGRILPPGWIERARTVTPPSDGWYGEHFWLAKDGTHRFTCNGFRGQYIVMDPAKDLVLVRSGDTEDGQKRALLPALAEVLDSRG